MRKVLKYLGFLPADIGTEPWPEQHHLMLSLQTKVQFDMNQGTNTFIDVVQVMDLPLCFCELEIKADLHNV